MKIVLTAAAAALTLCANSARVAMLPESSEVFQGAASFEEPGSGRVPNYLRALSTLPGSVKPMAHLMKTFIHGGSLPAETKLAMAVRIAELNQSGYTAAHMRRLLLNTEKGRALDASARTGKLQPAEKFALFYAEALTKSVHAPSDPEFRQARGWFNDSQIVELTFTVCLFNYFSRYASALNLPLEPWLGSKPAPPPPPVSPPPSRIALISDEEMKATRELVASAAASPLGLGIANSQRAMMRVPDLGLAWRAFGFVTRENAAVGRDIKLQVSFAVSMVNGCRYCTVHQVVGLRRLGVSPTKLMAMKKDDSELSPRESIAVRFARKLTSNPSSVTDADYGEIRKEFGEQGALEVLMQTCNFAFMNRFTDGLRLPSEDEAIRIYRETYGAPPTN